MKPAITMRQPWHCDHCGAAGEVHHLPENDALIVADLAEEQHAIAAPDCHEKQGNRGVRYAEKDQL